MDAVLLQETFKCDGQLEESSDFVRLSELIMRGYSQILEEGCE